MLVDQIDDLDEPLDQRRPSADRELFRCWFLVSARCTATSQARCKRKKDALSSSLPLLHCGVSQSRHQRVMAENLHNVAVDKPVPRKLHAAFTDVVRLTCEEKRTEPSGLILRLRTQRRWLVRPIVYQFCVHLVRSNSTGLFSGI